ncbi:MAG: hypothetical protein HY470_00920 [Candidatus Ryanbacteria bacterium]|nr:hypothetical protein [Candidatus Ryanbacteria bacterium]
MIFAGLFFGVFTAAYAACIAVCVHQEDELSLPHERAVRMTIAVIAIALVLWAVALISFLSVDWNTLLNIQNGLS